MFEKQRHGLCFANETDSQIRTRFVENERDYILREPLIVERKKGTPTNFFAVVLVVVERERGVLFCVEPKNVREAKTKQLHLLL
jgi:hypothetical protein